MALNKSFRLPVVLRKQCNGKVMWLRL